MKQKLFSVILAVVLLLCSLSPAASAAGGECACGYLPVVYISGLGSATIYLDKGTENEQVLFRPETDAYLSLVSSVLPDLVKLIAKKDYDAFGDSLIAALNPIFGMLAMDESGDSNPRVSAPRELPDNPEHGYNKDYYFGYDFRLDPFENARLLNAFIEHIKSLTGHDRVMVRASSMGGVVFMAYLAEFGSNSVDACIFQSAPLQGTEVAGELLTKRIHIDARALAEYAPNAADAGLGRDALSLLMNILYDTGVLPLLSGLANRVVENLFDKLYEEFLVPVFASMPGIWSFVSDKYFEEAVSMTLNESAQPELIGRVCKYHYEVQQSAGNLLNAAKANGMRIMIVAGYNIQRTPLVESYKNDSDATVDTKYASGGAVVALRGETLGASYVQQNACCGKNHLSPDNRIDASTCILPENTWFLKDMLHSTVHDGIKEFYNWFFYSEGPADVFSNERYPQFLQDDKENLSLFPLKRTEPPAAQPIAIKYVVAGVNILIKCFRLLSANWR